MHAHLRAMPPAARHRRNMHDTGTAGELKTFDFGKEQHLVPGALYTGAIALVVHLVLRIRLHKLRVAVDAVVLHTHGHTPLHTRFTS